MATTKRATRRQEPPFNPVQRLEFIQFFNSKDEVQGSALIYRDAIPPEADGRDPKPAPVRFRILDKNNAFVEDDTAETRGRALDYLLAYARGNNWTLTPETSFGVPKRTDD